MAAPRRTGRQVASALRARWLDQYRRARARPTVVVIQLVAIAVAVVAVVGRLPIPGYVAVWSSPGAYAAGQAVASGSAADSLAPGPADTALVTARGLAGLLVAVTCYGVVMRTAGGTDPGLADHRRLALSPPAFVAVDLLDRAAFVARFVGPIGVAAGVAFAVGAGSLLTAGLVTVATAALVTSATAASFPVAVAVSTLFDRVDWLRRHRLVFGGVLVATMGFALVRLRTSLVLLGAFPVGWYADLALLAAGVGASPARAAVALAVAPPAAVLGTVAAVRLSALGSDAPAGASRAPDATESGWSQPSPAWRLLACATSQPTAAVTRTLWLRLAREPRPLLLAGLVVGTTAGAALVVARAVPGALPSTVAVYVSVAVGAGVTLDLVGTEGPALPLALTAPAGGRRLLTGYALSAALPGTAAAAAAAVAVGSAVRLDLIVVGCAAVVGAVLGAVSPSVSLAVGLRLSPSGATDAVRSNRVDFPPLGALVAFSLVIVGVGAPAITGAAVTAADAQWTTPAVAGAVATVALATAIGRWSLADARRRLRRYEPG